MQTFNNRHLLLAALVASVAASAQARHPPVTDTSYRVINLAPGLLASIPDLNAKGQAVFSMQAPGGSSGYFFNGSTVQDIGSLGGSEVVAVDVNELGQVTGTSTTERGVEHSYVWSAGGGMVDLRSSDSGYARGSAINNRGVVTGMFLYGSSFAFRWSAASGFENLGALPSGGLRISFGSALNDAGLISGSSEADGGSRHAFAWTRAGGMVDIDNLNSYDSLPVAVGTLGEVAGNRIADRLSIGYRPYLWTAARGTVDLGMAGAREGGVLSMTPALRMAGVVTYGRSTQRAMAWTGTTVARNLGTLGGRSSRAYDANDRGQVVGFAHDRAGQWRAFVWTARTGMLDLNRYLRHAPAGLVLDDALAINDSGVIVATSNAGLVLLRPGDGGACGITLGPLLAPPMVKAGVQLQATVNFSDPERVGTRSVSWSWGDGSSAQAGTLREGGGSGQAGASHSFAAPGIYRVSASHVDRRGRRVVVTQDVVVTAASGAAVAGAGELEAPLGAARDAPFYAGKVHFRLIAPREAGARAQVPASLELDMPGLNFRSRELRVLERQDTHQVFEGSGTLRGAGNYQFRLITAASLNPGTPARMLLKIWHTDPASKAEIVDFDNASASSGPEAGMVIKGSIDL